MSSSDRANDPTARRRGGDGSRRLPRDLVAVVQSRFAGSAVEIFVKRLGALDFFQSVTVFGAVLLLSALPFIILMSSLANHSIDADLSRHIGLDGEGADIVSQLFTSSPIDSVSAIVTALIFATAGTMAVASSLQGIYERAFGQEHRGWRDLLRYLIWVGVLFCALVAESVINGPVRAGVGPVGQAFVTYVGIAAFFLWTMYFLLAGRVRWRMLVRTAIITALLWGGLDLFSSVYFSSALVSDNRIYGKIGVTFTLLTWFIAIGAIVVLGTALGTTWEQRKGHLGGPKADLLGIVHHRPSSGMARR